MNSDMKALRLELESQADPGHKQFMEKILPGTENILGLRMPRLRRIARRIALDDPLVYLAQVRDPCYEDLILQALVIGQLKDIDTAVKQARIFIPKISNWAVCDTFCNDFKIAKKNQAEIWEFIQPYLVSAQAFEVRTALVIMLNHFINETYIDRHFGIYDTITHQDYYVKMALAWAISFCFIKFPEKTRKYLEKNQLDDETFNKALQKICESLRVDKASKAEIRALKR